MKKVCWLLVVFAFAVSACSSKLTRKDSEKVNFSDLKSLHARYEKGTKELKDSVCDSIISAFLTEGVMRSVDDEGLCCLSGWAIQLPQCSKAKSNFLKDVQDVYNSFEASLCMWSDYEVWERALFISEEGADSTSVLASIKSLNVDCIANKDLHDKVVSMRDGVVWCIEHAAECDEENNFYVYINILHKEIYEKHIFADPDYQDELTSMAIYKDADSLEYARISDSLLGKGPHKWLDALMGASDFRSQCVLVLWSAQNAFYGMWTLEAMQKLMRSGQYCDLLPRLWLTWRCLVQQEYFGLSRDSIIPNNVFEYYRRLCFTTVVDYALDNHEDAQTMAMVYAFLSKSHLIRNGNCIIGNDCLLEMMEMIPHPSALTSSEHFPQEDDDLEQ